jgi:tetratricopeptide (TPR) repeat protein
MSRVSYSGIPNPYDFANPVTDERFFFGRDAQLSDVTYYLEQAKQTRRPIHLAFIGERAAGKTSFLNVAAIEAKRRGLNTVRIDLDEADAASPLNFFRKFYNSIVLSAFDFGAFGGRAGRSFEAYLDLISTYETSQPPEFQPFLFASIVARALASGRSDFAIPDDIMKRDMSLIYQNVKETTVILIDECNVLKENRIILEKLRNLLMNTQGFMLILAGTQDLFPAIDDIFSPIMRQFKKIEIGPFTNYSHAESCVQSPLRLSGLSRREIQTIVPQSVVREIFVLSGGKPYEILLICHFLFKRVQQGLAKRFSLDLRNIEDMQREIAVGQNVSERKTLQACKRQRRNTLHALSLLTAFDEPLRFEDCYNLEYVFHGTARFTRETLDEELRTLIQAEIAEIIDGRIQMLGDMFDRLYIKYLARQKGVIASFAERPLSHVISMKISAILEGFSSIREFDYYKVSEEIDDLEDVCYLVEGRADEKESDFNPITEGLVYHALTSGAAGKEIIVGSIHVRTREVAIQKFFIWQDIDEIAKYKKMESRLFEVGLRSQSVGWDWSLDTRHVSVKPLDDLVDAVTKVGDEQFKKRVADSIMRQLIPHIHIDERDTSKAVHFASIAHSVCGTRMVSGANNVGYLYMSQKNYDEARLWFEAALQWKEDDELCLLVYNYAILEAMVKDYPRAISYLNRCLAEKAARDHQPSVVIRAKKGGDGNVEFYEDFSPPTVEVLARDALSIFQALASP